MVDCQYGLGLSRIEACEFFSLHITTNSFLEAFFASPMDARSGAGVTWRVGVELP